ncbi:serine/threonine protein kinase [Saccharophagus degradans]|uniref:serine/threonine protein kinase n=1 Tax=Saccharophagus degradans TaxID=86304 RepID=UPI001C09E054|nr:serine/threonine protein kinase [Saccharophagus degradans]
MSEDLNGLKSLLTSHYSGLRVKGTAKASGQRKVFYVEFADFERIEPEEDSRILYKWSQWGECVLKVSNGSNPIKVARSQQEIVALMEINSPYYPKLFHHELLTFDPRNETPLKIKHYVTIESKIPGCPLSEVMDVYNSEEKVRNLLINLVIGLKELWEHKKYYVHRDLKPENIIIQPSGSPVIIDLGIMRESGAQGVTATVNQFGPCTPAYASPEQAKNDKFNISYKADMFSLGALAYTLLAGGNPFLTREGISVVEILENVISHTPEPLHSVANVSKEFSDIVSKLMEKEPYKRYRLPERLIEELKALEE